MHYHPPFGGSEMLSIPLILIGSVGLALAVLFLAMDWLQTLWIARNPLRVYEINVILGKHPSVAAVCLYFAICIAIVVAVSVALWFFAHYLAAIVLTYIVALFEAVVVWRNHTLNIPIST
jgi:hypothetical protein